jgi:hypothetical protein
VRWYQIVFGMILAIGASACGAYSLDAGQASGQSSGLPPDVHPVTRNRLPPVLREDLSDAQKTVYDRLVSAGRSLEGLQGAAGLRLHGSEGNRGESPAGARLIELAIITTAREENQQFEWTLHEIRAREAGVGYGLIDVVRFKKPLRGVPERDASVIQLGRDVFTLNRVGSDLYRRALDLLGKEVLVDVTATMAHYCASAVALNAFDQQLPLMPIPVTEFPKDIHSDSRNRLPMLKDDATRRGGIAPAGTGPASIRRHGSGSRALAEAALGPRLQSLAALVTARELDSQYDWTLNELQGLNHGLEPAIIDIVRSRKPLTGLPEKEAAAIALGREVFGEHRRVRSETYSRALKAFGEKTLVDLVVVMGEHCDDHIMLTAFDQHLPSGQKPLLPID